MTNLTAYKSEAGVELYIDNITGEAFATQAGYARMSGVIKSTISMRMKGIQFQALKTAEVHTPGGLQLVRLIPSSLVFKWAMKDNRALAYAMGTAGATVYLQKLAGYKVTSTAVVEDKSSDTYIEALRALVVSLNEAADAIESKELAEARVAE